MTIKFLEQFEEFRDFRKRKKKVTGNGGDNNDKETGKTPAEELETAYENLRENLAKELIEKFKECPPSLFEKIIVELLVKMGYGGSRKDAGQAIGKSGDEPRQPIAAPALVFL